ncbi:MAG TPA: protein-L-isoaspartate O-methyltransferase [Lautropia sp.]|jgi:protein-L-isoaspartate(D-aspartate) O-methyltransferase|nr:protein-L-isoaspartate O-methyltransferase [Lautropia sp.]
MAPKPELVGRSIPQAAQLPAVSGLGLDSDKARFRLIDTLAQLHHLDTSLVDVMRAVPRHRFVEPAFASRAYEDVALPIGHQQTISKPSTVARMIDRVLKHLSGKDRKRLKILEIGTGCGYQAAVLSRLFGEVYSIERIKDLHLLAKRNLRGMQCFNLRMLFADGLIGLAQAAPFDAIIAAAAGEAIPEAWMHQLSLEGILLTPISSPGGQVLEQVIKLGHGKFQHMQLDAVRFVPLLQGTR